MSKCKTCARRFDCPQGAKKDDIDAGDLDCSACIKTADSVNGDERTLGQSLDTAKEIITGERQDQYGNPEDSFRVIADYWSTFLSHRFQSDIKIQPIDAANMMILFKQARKLGQKPSIDNYIDSIGYEAIGADRLMG